MAIREIVNIEALHAWHTREKRRSADVRGSQRGDADGGAGRACVAQSTRGAAGMALAWGMYVEFATLEWVDWFNHRRLLEPIGDLPPAEYEARYHQQAAVA